MKDLRIALGSALVIVIAACGGTVVVDGLPNGGGGQGGDVGTTSSFNSTTSSFNSTTGSFNSTVGSGNTTTGSTGGSCQHCADLLVSGPNGGPICDISSGLLKELFNCACNTLCADVCASNSCNLPLRPSNTCKLCLTDTSKGCGFEFNNCFNDE